MAYLLFRVTATFQTPICHCFLHSSPIVVFSNFSYQFVFPFLKYCSFLNNHASLLAKTTTRCLYENLNYQISHSFHGKLIFISNSSHYQTVIDFSKNKPTRIWAQHSHFYLQTFHDNFIKEIDKILSINCNVRQRIGKSKRNFVGVR